MKKITSILIALLLCLSGVAALAESVPSKTVADLVKVEATAENLPEDSGFYVQIVLITEADENTEEYKRHMEICNAEVEKLRQVENVEDYFNVDADLKAIVGSDTLNVYEFGAVFVGNYDISYGKVTLKMLLSTPYEVGEKVAVMIGQATENADGTVDVAWKAFEGVGVEFDADEATGTDDVVNEGAILVEMDAETIAAIQEGIALFAVVSD